MSNALPPAASLISGPTTVLRVSSHGIAAHGREPLAGDQRVTKTGRETQRPAEAKTTPEPTAIGDTAARGIL